MRKIVIMICLGVLMATFLISYTDPLNRNQSPLAEKGVIDLTSWDLHKDGLATLQGEWEYYDKQLLGPEDFDVRMGKNPKITGYNISKSYRKNLIKRFTYSDKTYGTFRVTVKLKNSDQYIGIKINNEKVYIKNKLFINGERIGFSGDIIEQEINKSDRNTYNEFFQNDTDTIDIILQVEDFYQPFSIDEYYLVLGLQQDLNSSEIIKNATELCAAVLCFMIALYYIYIYFGGKRTKEIKFSISEFLSLTMFFLFSGEKFIYWVFPNISLEVYIKFLYFSIACIPYSIIGYANLVANKVVSNRMYKIVRNVFYIYTILLVFTPYKINIYFIQSIFIPILILYLYMMFRIGFVLEKFKQNNNYNNEATIYLLCLSCIFIHYYNNILFYWSLVSTKLISVLVAIIFIFLSQIFLAFSYAHNYKKMDEMEKAKDEFYMNSSYVLNAPLQSILNIATSVINKVDEHENFYIEVLSDAIMIQDITSNLIDIVNATFDVTLMQNNQLQLSKTPIDMKIEVELLVESIKELHDKKKIEIVSDIEESLIALADAGRVQQILHNLLTNSIYSMTEGKIIIRGVRNGRMVSISVIDNGCGISKEQQEEIYQPYVSFHSEGIGLGLYLSRQLALHMDGNLNLEWSKLGKGSKFVLTLPNYSEEFNEEVEKNIGVRCINQFNPYSHYPSKAEGNSKTILIVDDEMFNIQTAAIILESEGYNIVSACSGDEALKMLEKYKIDLVILDVMMPGVSGITTCKNIREKYSIIELPILLSTRINVNNDVNLGLLAQANDTITKPYKEKELRARVKTLIALKTSIEDAAKSEQAFLQAQIKPHFIYNAINTIISFCYTDSEKAAKLLAEFSKYLRLIFDIDNMNMFVSIQKELELVKAYVEIQNARFSNRFIVEYDIETILFEEQIPSLMIQPLVENAIRHGYYQIQGMGHIYVSIKKVDERLVIRVKDNGSGMSKEKLELLKNKEFKSTGVGMWNIKRRIAKMKEATINIESEINKGTIVTISMLI